MAKPYTTDKKIMYMGCIMYLIWLQAHNVYNIIGIYLRIYIYLKDLGRKDVFNSNFTIISI